MKINQTGVALALILAATTASVAQTARQPRADAASRYAATAPVDTRDQHTNRGDNSDVIRLWEERIQEKR